MPPLSRWFVRASLVYLVFGFTAGAALLAHKGVPFAPWLWRLRPAHGELLLFGWVVQLVMGVAWWIFPRAGLRAVPAGARSRGGWVAFALLNAGVWLGVAATLAPLGAAARLAGRLAELGAAGAFAGAVWARVRPGLSEI